MRRVPSSVQGMLFAPAAVTLFFLLKTFCPESAGNMCFSDQFSLPIFLPLAAIYRLFGGNGVIFGQDFLFVLLYWAAVGFLLGLIFDLWSKGQNDKLQMSNQAKSLND